MAPDNLLRAALFVYGLPLAGAIIASAVAWSFGVGDHAAAALALVGAGMGIVLGRLRLGKAGCLRDFTPTVTERLAVAGD